MCVCVCVCACVYARVHYSIAQYFTVKAPSSQSLGYLESFLPSMENLHLFLTEQRVLDDFFVQGVVYLRTFVFRDTLTYHGLQLLLEICTELLQVFLVLYESWVNS